MLSTRSSLLMLFLVAAPDQPAAIMSFLTQCMLDGLLHLRRYSWPVTPPVCSLMSRIAYARKAVLGGSGTARDVSCCNSWPARCCCHHTPAAAADQELAQGVKLFASRFVEVAGLDIGHWQLRGTAI